MINSQSQLEDKINLVKWEHQAERQRFSLLTIHSLLLDNNPKFKKLRQTVENYNNEKAPTRIKLQQNFVEKLFKMLSELTRIPIFQNQLEYLNKIYEWASTNKEFNDDDNTQGEEPKQRPITATTKARTHSAYSRSTANRPISGNYQKKISKNEQLPPYKIIDKKIDYTKLKDGQKQFYCGFRTLHQQYEHPQKRLKQYQRKIFYEQDNDSDVEIIDLDPKVEVNEQKLMDEMQLAQEEEEVDGEGQDGAEGGQNQEAGDINIDDIPIEGEEEVVEGQEEEKIIVDKLKPKIKAYHDAKGINQISQRHYYDGVAELRKNGNYKERKVDEDVEIAQLKAIWAQTKGRTRSQLNRRAESARMIKKTYGIKQQKKQPGVQEKGRENFINFQNVNPHNVNTKGSRPQTAFISTNLKNREQLIKNAFISGKISTHVKKYEPGTTLSIPSQFNIVGSALGAHADPPKKKTFEQILRQAEQKVIRQSYDQIQDIKQAFAKNKICINGNRIAKSITHYDRQLAGDAFVGQITGTTMLKNPFIKVTKKKKKKKKK